MWTSPLGCLMFTCRRRLRVASPAQAPFINYLVCLAVTRGVREALQVGHRLGQQMVARVGIQVIHRYAINRHHGVASHVVSRTVRRRCRGAAGKRK